MELASLRPASASSFLYLTEETMSLRVPMASLSLKASRGCNSRRVTCNVSKPAASHIAGVPAHPYVHSTRFRQLRSKSLVKEAPTNAQELATAQRSSRRRRSRRKNRSPDESGSEHLSDPSRSESNSEDELDEVLGQLLSLNVAGSVAGTGESAPRKEKQRLEEKVRGGKEGSDGAGNAASDALFALLKPSKEERKNQGQRKEMGPERETAGASVLPPTATVSPVDSSNAGNGDAAARPVGDPLGKKVLGKAVTLWVSNAASAMARDLVERELREGEVALPRSSVAVVELSRSYLRR